MSRTALYSFLGWSDAALEINFDPIEFSNSSSSLQLKLLEILPDNLPTPGDREIGVYVASLGFTGTSNIWLDQLSIQQFLLDLANLEKLRDGTAQIRSISPNEFSLRVGFYDGFKHISFDGYLSERFNGLENRVAFSIRPDTSMLKQYVDELYRLLSRSDS